MADFLTDAWPHAAAFLTVALAAAASAHAILTKEDSLSAVAWVGVIWLVPLVGAALYVLLGINRIRRRAKALRGDGRHAPRPEGPEGGTPGRPVPGHLAALSRLVGQVVQRPLLEGNRVQPFPDGEAAYAAMIEAIRGARRSVALSTYIFDNDDAGDMFFEALAHARGHGAEVLVLVDDMGARYSFPPMTRRLRHAGIRAERFLPTLLPWRMPFINLRNHRKILVVDGRVGFTGGANIREGMLLSRNPGKPIRDLHFKVEGPVVAHLREAFAADWQFTTGSRLEGEDWFPGLEPVGEVAARGIPDGPDEDFELLFWTVHGALACARDSVTIVTPYFVPGRTLITSLNLAAMRGVRVDIVLPARNNLPVVQWASTGLLPQLLGHGCRVWLTEGPFDHSKLMLVDGAWALFGSGNWDQRSLRLNFEFNVECYDRKLASELEGLVRSKLQKARELTSEDLGRRPLPLKLRDGVARLFSPYL
ncbi:MAG: cardiolipin synthase [Thermodesulfovibrionales bacterium]